MNRILFTIVYFSIINIAVSQNTLEYYTSDAKKKLNLADYNGVMNDCNDAVKYYPNRYEVYLLRGSMKYVMQDYNGALLDLNKSLSLNNQDAQTYKFLSQVKLNLKDTTGAINEINIAIKFDSLNAETLEGRGMLELETGQDSLSKKDFNKVILIFTNKLLKDTNNSYFYFARATAKLYIKDFLGCCSDLKKAKELGFVPAEEYIKKYCQ